MAYPYVRSRFYEPVSYTNTLPGVANPNLIPARAKGVFRSTKLSGSNSILHTKITNISPSSGVKFTYDTGDTISFDGDCPVYTELATVEDVALRYAPNHPLNRNKLESSSDFGLLEALAEFDDTIAIFAARFWRNLSYGSFTWGLQPFVADLQALYDQANSLRRRFAGEIPQYEDEQTTEVSVPVQNVFTTSGETSGIFNATYTQRHTGTYTLPGAPILEAFDRLGFHPDVATAWNLVPFSFVADYLFPIGDALEGLSDRGWIKAVNFSGWRTIKCVGSLEPIRREKGSVSGGFSERVEFELFKRDRLSSFVLLDSLDDLPSPGISRPSWRQMLNMAYLAGSNRRRR